MSWYSKIKLIKTAAAKSKIQRYNIATPSVKFFIHRYEKDIPWEEVEKAKNNGENIDAYIQQYISSTKMPELSAKIDGQNKEDPRTNFMKQISIDEVAARTELNHTAEAQGHPTKDPKASEAEGGYPDSLVEMAQRTMLDDVNNEKEIQFNEWWKYMNEENIYSQDPAFQYSALQPIIDSSPPDKKNCSPPLNSAVLTKIWEEITQKGVDQMNILKKYKKLIMKAERKRSEKEGIQITEKGGRWIRIKGGPSVNSKSELAENIKRLKNLSQNTQWCTEGGMADIYLPRGDFYLYIVDDQAKVAIRCEGNTVFEIRGYNNKQEHLDPYWKEVMDFLPITTLDYQDNKYYKLLEEIQMMNEEMVEGSPIYHKVLKRIQEDHTYYLKLSDENKTNFEEFRKTAALGYRVDLEKILKDIEKSDESSYIFSFGTFQEKYDEIPEEIRAELPDMQARVLQVHKIAYRNNPNLFTEFSPAIQSQFTPEEQRDGWFLYVDSDPYHYNDPRIPERVEGLPVKSAIPLAPLKAKWKKLISENAEHVDHLNKNILGLFQPGEIDELILEDFASFPYAKVGGRLIKLERVEKLVNEGRIDRQRIMDILSNEIRKNPQDANWINNFPDEYKNELLGQTNVQTVVNDNNWSYILKDIGSFIGLSEVDKKTLLQQHGEELGEAFGETLSTKYMNTGHDAFWTSVPKEVRPYIPFEIIDATAQYYANEINANTNPSNQEEFIKKYVPGDILPFVFSKLGASKSWYKRACHELV
jgi:hypothetical protein